MKKSVITVIDSSSDGDELTFKDFEDRYKRLQIKRENDLKRDIETNSDSGFLRVSRIDEYINRWQYNYNNVTIKAFSLDELKYRVINQHLPWQVVDYEMANKSLKDEFK